MDEPSQDPPSLSFGDFISNIIVFDYAALTRYMNSMRCYVLIFLIFVIALVIALGITLSLHFYHHNNEHLTVKDGFTYGNMDIDNTISICHRNIEGQDTKQYYVLTNDKIIHALSHDMVTTRVYNITEIYSHKPNTIRCIDSKSSIYISSDETNTVSEYSIMGNNIFHVIDISLDSFPPVETVGIRSFAINNNNIYFNYIYHDILKIFKHINDDNFIVVDNDTNDIVVVDNLNYYYCRDVLLFSDTSNNILEYRHSLNQYVNIITDTPFTISDFTIMELNYHIQRSYSYLVTIGTNGEYAIYCIEFSDSGNCHANNLSS